MSTITMRCERCERTRTITEAQAKRIMDEAVPTWADEIHTHACDQCDPDVVMFEAAWGRLVAAGTLAACRPEKGADHG